MQLYLGKSPLSNLPTDDRLKAAQQGKEDTGLIALYFQYGRYLLMGSSLRPGVLPANLQSIWNEDHLVTAPSHSPENRFILPGTRDRFTLIYYATIDIQIIKALFSNCIAAGEIQNVDSEFRNKLKAVLQKLPPFQIGKDGTIQEWIEDYEEAEPGHRHMSHPLRLYPLAQITLRTPELFQAAKNTIQKRLQHGGGHTGWSRAWIINFFARLLDGEKAYENF